MLLRKLAHISKDGASAIEGNPSTTNIFNVSFLRRIESFYLPPTVLLFYPSLFNFFSKKVSAFQFLQITV